MPSLYSVGVSVFENGLLQVWQKNSYWGMNLALLHHKSILDPGRARFNVNNSDGMKRATKGRVSYDVCGLLLGGGYEARGRLLCRTEGRRKAFACST